MIYAYSFLKNVGVRGLLKRGVCPTTPTSEAQRTWALKGVADGLYAFYTPSVGVILPMKR